MFSPTLLPFFIIISVVLLFAQPAPRMAFSLSPVLLLPSTDRSGCTINWSHLPHGVHRPGPGYSYNNRTEPTNLALHHYPRFILPGFISPSLAICFSFPRAGPHGKHRHIWSTAKSIVLCFMRTACRYRYLYFLFSHSVAAERNPLGVVFGAG